VHFVPGSMLAFASRSIARFASLEYRFAVEDRFTCYVLCVTMKRLDSCFAISPSSHRAISPFSHSAIWPSSCPARRLEKEQFLCSAVRYTPIRKANDTPSMRQREILPRSDTPFFCPRIFTDFHELASGLPGFSVQISRRFFHGE